MLVPDYIEQGLGIAIEHLHHDTVDRRRDGVAQDWTQVLLGQPQEFREGSIGRLLAPVAEQVENEEEGRLLRTLGWRQRQKLFNERDEARRKPRTVGCRSAQRGAREAVRLAEGREDGMLVHDDLLVHGTRRGLTRCFLASHACGRLSLMSGMPVRNTASLQCPV